jgi:hypothetical protein
MIALGRVHISIGDSATYAQKPGGHMRAKKIENVTWMNGGSL